MKWVSSVFSTTSLFTHRAILIAPFSCTSRSFPWLSKRPSRGRTLAGLENIALNITTRCVVSFRNMSELSCALPSEFKVEPQVYCQKFVMRIYFYKLFWSTCTFRFQISFDTSFFWFLMYVSLAYLYSKWFNGVDNVHSNHTMRTSSPIRMQSDDFFSARIAAVPICCIILDCISTMPRVFQMIYEAWLSLALRFC